MACRPFDEQCGSFNVRGKPLVASAWFDAMRADDSLLKAMERENERKVFGVHEDGMYSDAVERLAFRNGVELYRWVEPRKFCSYSWFGLRCQVPPCIGKVEFT